MDTFSPADVCNKTYLFAKCTSPLLFLKNKIKRKKKSEIISNEKSSCTLFVCPELKGLKFRFKFKGLI